MIRSPEQYQRTRSYIERLERILFDMRSTHTVSQYEGMSKAYLVELAKAQREIVMYLATPACCDMPASPESQQDAA